MKYYKEICIHCLKERTATQIDELPIPNTAMLMTKGYVPDVNATRWVSCNVLKEHTFVNKQNYVEGKISLNGQKVIPRI